MSAALCESTTRQRKKTIDFGLNCLFNVRKTKRVQNLAAKEVSLQSNGLVCQVELFCEMTQLEPQVKDSPWITSSLILNCLLECSVWLEPFGSLGMKEAHFQHLLLTAGGNLSINQRKDDKKKPRADQIRSAGVCLLGCATHIEKVCLI